MGDEEMEDVAEERDLRRALPRRAIERLEEGPVVVRAPPDVTVSKNGPHRPKITKIGPSRGNCRGQDLFPLRILMAGLLEGPMRRQTLFLPALTCLLPVSYTHLR